jgi:hypothetical protein
MVTKDFSVPCLWLSRSSLDSLLIHLLNLHLRSPITVFINSPPISKSSIPGILHIIPDTLNATYFNVISPTTDMRVNNVVSDLIKMEVEDSKIQFYQLVSLFTNYICSWLDPHFM